MKNNYDTEQQDIERARRGDAGAFNQLVEVYQRPVFNLCYRMLGNAVEAEDAAQETFVRAYTRLASYDIQRKFSSWLLAIASHYCIDQLRRRHLHVLSWDAMLPEDGLPDEQPGPEQIALRRDTQRQVQRLLKGLPPDYRAAIVLRYWYDLSYEEIAQSLDTTVPTIKSRLFRARQVLARAVQQSPALSIEADVGYLAAAQAA